MTSPSPRLAPVTIATRFAFIHGFDLLETNRLHTASIFKCT